MVDEAEQTRGREIGDSVLGTQGADMKSESDIADFDRRFGRPDEGDYGAVQRSESDRPRASAPGLDHEGMCGDVLVGDTIVGAPCAVGLGGHHGTIRGSRDLGHYDKKSSVYLIPLELHRYGRAAVSFGSLFDNVDVFLVPDAGDNTVVLDADKESASVVVGEGGY